VRLVLCTQAVARPVRMRTLAHVLWRFFSFLKISFFFVVCSLVDDDKFSLTGPCSFRWEFHSHASSSFHLKTSRGVRREQTPGTRGQRGADLRGRSEGTPAEDLHATWSVRRDTCQRGADLHARCRGDLDEGCPERAARLQHGTRPMLAAVVVLRCESPLPATHRTAEQMGKPGAPWPESMIQKRTHTAWHPTHGHTGTSIQSKT